MKLKSAMNYYNQHGCLETSKRILDKIGLKFIDRSIILVKLDLHSIPLDTQVSCQTVILSQEDVQKDRDYCDGWCTKEEALSRLKEGHLLFAIKKNEKIICYEWAEFNKVKIAYMDLHFCLPEDGAYLTRRFTVPEFRGKGIASQLERAIFQYLKMQGYCYLLGVTDPINQAAVGMNRKTGWEDYQIIQYQRYWFIKYYCVTKCNATECKRFITLFRAPKNIWKVFL